MSDVLRELNDAAEKAGLTIVEFSLGGHYRIEGGAFLVNYYPCSKKRTAYVNGTRGGLFNVTPAQAVALAIKVPDKVASPKKRKRHKLQKRRLMRKQKGLCHWCHEEMILTDDATNPLQVTIEHVIPLGRGGADHSCNIVLAHKKCNNERSDDMPELENV